MKNDVYTLNNVRVAFLRLVGTTAIGCFVLITILLTNSVSAKTVSANKNIANQARLDGLSFNKTHPKNLAKMCSFSSAGKVTYFVCYVACRAAGHEVSFCVNSCSLIAELPDILSVTNQERVDSESESESKVKNRVTRLIKGLTPEQVQEFKLSVILIEAARFGDTQTMREMLDFGANANIKVSDFYVGNKNIFDRKADFTKLEMSDTPLLAAVKHDAEIEAIKLLVTRGANVNVETKGGKTPLKLATEKGRDDIVQLLIESGAK